MVLSLASALTLTGMGNGDWLKYRRKFASMVMLRFAGVFTIAMAMVFTPVMKFFCRPTTRCQNGARLPPVIVLLLLTSPSPTYERYTSFPFTYSTTPARQYTPSSYDVAVATLFAVTCCLMNHTGRSTAGPTPFSSV